MNHSIWQQAENWVTEQVGPVGERTVIKDTDVSTVIQFSTTKGDAYFLKKASSFEGRLSDHLSSHHTGKTASVVAVHEVEPWFLMKEIGGDTLRGQKDKALWQQALREYARLQVSETDHVETLIAMGVPDRRMPILKEEIRTHLADMCATGLTEEETGQVLSLESELLDMCDVLDTLVPASIEHGDLHTNNIVTVDHEPVFFDWGDASVSHPFFSTRIYWHALDDLLESKDEWLGMVDEFRPYYLAPWTQFASIEELENGLRLADELACVQRAITWHAYITPLRENKEESYNRPAQWLRLWLEHRRLVGK